MGHVRVGGFGALVVALAAVVAVSAAPSVVAMVLTWRASRERRPPPVWGRLYALLAVAAVVVTAAQITGAASRQFFRVFDIPAASMAPALAVGDHLVADMRRRGPPRRGDIVLFERGDAVWIKRVVALPGDRIAMRGRVPVINGEPAAHIAVGPIRVEDNGTRTLEGFRESLPGAAGEPHTILRGGPTSPLGEMAEVVVPPGAVFVLGDHRDNSLDSRVPAAAGGVGMVPMGAIVGRPLYVAFARDRARIGLALDR